MKKLGLLTAIAAMLLVVPAAFADHEEIGGIYKPAGHHAICMLRCDGDSGSDCRFGLRIYDDNGNIVASQNFNNVPPNGSRMLIYSGPKKLLTCERRGPDNGNLTDIGWAVTNATWHTVALANQDE